jgi:hypothetical protein
MKPCLQLYPQPFQLHAWLTPPTANYSNEVASRSHLTFLYKLLSKDVQAGKEVARLALCSEGPSVVSYLPQDLLKDDAFVKNVLDDQEVRARKDTLHTATMRLSKFSCTALEAFETSSMPFCNRCLTDCIKSHQVSMKYVVRTCLADRLGTCCLGDASCFCVLCVLVL